MNPRIKTYPDGTLDDFVAVDVQMVHFEAVDDCRWYATIFLDDGNIWTLNFGSATPRAKGFANAEHQC